MTIIRRILLAAFACSAMSACASAPINLAAEATAGAPAPAMASERLALRDAVDQLTITYRESGWTPGSTSLAERWAGRLTDEAAASDGLLTPAETYLRDRGVTTARAAAQVLHDDLTEARALAAYVDAAAINLIQGGAGFTRAQVTDDLGEVERSIAATRRALDLFADAIALIDADLDAARRAELAERRAMFAATADRLSDRADEFAALRRAMRSGAFS